MNQDSNTQRRLELMRLIREENHNNQQRIRTREEILYGKSGSYSSSDEYGYPLSAAEYSRPEEGVHMSSFGLRLVIAVLLFGIYFLPGAGPQHRRHYGSSDRDSGKCAGRDKAC